VQVRSARATGGADGADALPGADRLPGAHVDRGEVGVQRSQPEAVADDDHVAEARGVVAADTTVPNPAAPTGVPVAAGKSTPA